MPDQLPLTDRLESAASEIDALFPADISTSILLREAKEALGAWLAWSGGDYPDDSPGDVIAYERDGTITLDDGITTWNPLRALAAAAKRAEAAEARAEKYREALERLGSREAFNGARALHHSDPRAIAVEFSARIAFAREALGGPDEGKDDIPRDAEGLPDDGQDPPFEGAEADRPEDLPAPSNAAKRYEELDGG